MTKQTKPVELYYWPTPNGWKVSILLEELQCPYDTRYINIGAGEQFAPDFLKIAPNNRMPAIIDPEGPGGQALSVFESGAILQYLARKFEQFYPQDTASRVEVEQWLMWQMGGFGPMLGQNHHFRIYASEDSPYAKKRYLDETHRLYGVLDRRLANRDFIAGAYSIADMATIGWARGWERQGMDIDADFPHVKQWMARVLSRPAVERGLALGKEKREELDLKSNNNAQSVLFGQRGT